MFALEHHVRVFVFQVLEREIQYLLLRHKPVAEWPLGPIVGAIAPDEHLRDAVVREVREGTGIHKPLHVIDLSHPTKELFGDVGLVEWHFAYQAGTPTRPIREVTPGPRVGEIAWMSFEDAFRRIETSDDRESLVKLQLKLHTQ
jgi:8-oxo-dGTP pyrophosphatase MutT (NUDIX family)